MTGFKLGEGPLEGETDEEWHERERVEKVVWRWPMLWERS